MSLPDASRLSSLAPDRWRAFGVRLAEIGVTHDTLADLTKPVEAVPYEQRTALRRHHLRRAQTHAANAMRIFFYGDETGEPEARLALGDALFDALLSVGFVERRAGGVVSPFLLTFHGEFFVVVDDLARGEDAVMGSGPTTLTLSRASVPVTKVARGLDFGCGSAPNALALAQRAAHVVGIDINPRAITLARINAAINGIENVEFRVGDMFAPVAGESFDVIVSQPPFVSRPEGEEARTYLYGGARGDEFPLRVLQDAPGLLAPGGVCVFFIEWPEVEGESLAERLRAAQPSGDFDLLVLRAPPTSIDAHAAGYAYAQHAKIDDEYARAAVARRENFERLHIGAIRTTLTVLRRVPPGRSGWTATIDIRPFDALVPSRLRIDRLLAARDLLENKDDALLRAATLRFPKRTKFHAERAAPDPESTPKLTARFSERALVLPYALDRQSFLLLSLVHMSKTVDDAVKFMAKTWSVPVHEAQQRLLPHVKDALAKGALEIPPS